MQHLANAIQTHLDNLVDQYDARLQAMPGYANFPATNRRDLERQILKLIASCLMIDDSHELVQYIAQRAAQWSALGLDLAWFQQALVVPEEILVPLIESVEASTFLWRALNRGQAAVWQLVAQRLQQSEERFRRFSAATEEGLLFHEQGKILDVNSATLALFGYSAVSDIIGRNLLEFIVPDSRALVVQKMQLDDVHPYEVQCIRQDGTTFPVETSTRTYQYDGRTVRASSVRDITEHKRAEEGLRDSEERLRAIYEGTSDAVMLLNEQGFFDCNPRTLDMFGFKTREEFTAVHPADVSPQLQPDGQESLPAAQAHIQTAYQQGYDRFEWIHRRTTGEDFPAEVLLSAFDLGGQRVLQATVRDITERKQAEDQIERNLQETRVRLEVSQALAGQKTEDEVLVTLARQAGIYPQALVTFATFDRSRDETVAVARYAESFESGMVPTLPMGTRFPFSQFPLFRLLSADRPFVSQDSQADDRLDTTSLEITRETGAAGFAVFPITANNEWLGYMMVFARTAGFFDEGKQHLYQTLVDQGALALQTARLRDQIQASLERRGAQVQTSTEVAQEIASAIDLNELFKRVVTLIKERFDYYYAQIFRYDADQDAVVLLTGYGEAGQKMLAAQHKLKLGQGVVGAAAELGHSLLATDVTQDPDWNPNPYLPDTKGELAVPIKLHDQVLGILDVQADRAGALTDEDRLLVEGLCGQIAIAMESARLFDELRSNEAELSQALKIGKLAYWEYDVEKDLFLFNDQFFAIFHTTAERHGGYQLSSAYYAQHFVHPDDLPIVGAEIEKALNSTDRHYSRSLEHRILYDNGGVGYISVNINIDRDEQGKILRYYGANQDITDRKEAEEAIRHSEAQLSEALQIARLAYWEYDVANDLFLFNDQFYAIFHTTAEQHGGYQLSSAYYAQHFVHPDDLAVVGTEIEKALNSTDRHYHQLLEHRILYADGGVGHISVDINIDRDEQGRILRYYGANQDITDRKLAEAALSEERTRLRTLIDNLPVSVFIKDRDSRFVVNNAVHLRILGADSQEAVRGKWDFDFFPHELAAQYYADEQELMRIGQPLFDREEFVIDQSTGTRQWALSTKVPLRDMHGEVTGFLGFTQDITERKQSELRLQELLGMVQQSERLMRTLIDALPDHIYAKDLEGRLILVNLAEAQLHSVDTPEMLMGKSDFDLYPRELAEQYHASELPVLRDGVPLIDYEEPNLDATGQMRWSSTTKVPLRNNEGQITGLVGITRDITGRKEAEETLRRSEAELAEALKIAKLAYWEYDVEKDLFLFNDQFFSIFHTTAEQHGGYQLSSAYYAQHFVYPDDLAVVGTEIEMALNSTDRHYHKLLEHRILYADGGVGHISVDINIDRDEQGHILRYYGANQDITERQRSQEQLRLLTSAVEAAATGIAITDRSGKIEWINPGFTRLTGYTLEEAAGQNPRVLKSGKMSPEFYHDMWQTILSGQVWHGELINRRKDGTDYSEEMTITPVRSRGDEITHYIALKQDVTERKAAEEAIRRSEAQLSEALKTARLAYWELDLARQKFIFNDQLYALLHTTAGAEGGYEMDINAYVQRFIYPEDIPYVGATIAQGLQNPDPNTSTQLEARVVCADGEVRWLATRVNTKVDEAGQAFKAVGTNQDITERKQAEAALHASEEKYRDLINGMNDTICVIDFDTTIVDVNNAATRVLGYTRDELLSMKIPDIDANLAPDQIQNLAGSMPRDKVQVFETLHKTKTGERLPVEVSSSLVSYGGQTVILSIARDITERKLAEAEREKLLVEQRKRALQLQTAAEVSRATSSILNLDELLPQAVELVRARFNLYYVGIFLNDESERQAVLRAGTGDAGQKMLAKGHKLQIGAASMISQCIVQQRAQIALDVGEEAVRFNNPLLPLTRSELALPLISRGRVIGAVTIQSDQPAAFTTDDIIVLQTMADQIGNAIENAQLYEQSTAALQEVDALNRRLTGEGWETYLGRRSNQPVIWAGDNEALAPAALAAPDEQLANGQIVVEAADDDGQQTTVSVPVMLRGQTIGALRIAMPEAAYTDELRTTLESLAGHVAQAAENARLLDETQTRFARERALGAATDKIRSRSEVERILQTATEELAYYLQASAIGVRLGPGEPPAAETRQPG